MDTRYDYRIYCEDHGQWVEGTTADRNYKLCPRNETHSVRASTHEITRVISPQVVTLAEEEIATNANYKCDGVAFTAAAGTPVPDEVDEWGEPLVTPTITTHDIQYPFAINLLSASTMASTKHDGNTVSVYFVPDTVIGASTQISGADSDSVLHLPAAAMAAFTVGDLVSVRDSKGSEPLGTVTAVDPDAATVTVTSDPTRPFAVGSTVTVGLLDTVLMEDCLPLRCIEVTEDVVKYASVGMSVRLSDGTGHEDLGRIVEVDRARTHIWVERAPTRTFATGSYISVTRYYIQDCELGESGSVGFSTTRNKGSYVDRTRTGRISYTNRKPYPVRFRMMLQYLH
jgi:hypothetical protein